MTSRALPIGLLLTLASTAHATTQSADRVAAAREAGLADGVAWDILEGLTTEIGQRAAGTEAEARARTWAVTKLTALGFANVHVEPFDMDVWMRGQEEARIVSPFPQRLVLAALGNSGATPPEGVTAEVIGFQSLAALEAAPAAAVRGRIVFVDHHMTATQDGSSYGYFVQLRSKVPNIAAQKGAAAALIRSIGTDHHRVPHAGVLNWQAGTAPIPAAALSVPDAEQLTRILAHAHGGKVTMRLLLTPHPVAGQHSGNVVAEVPGRDPSLGPVVIGGHLDSWDLGTGAIDDGAGIAITTAAAKHLLEGLRPLRTIRVVWFGAEEVGLFGGEAYLRAHRTERTALLAESDFGADRIWRFQTRFADAAKPVADRIEQALLPLGIARGDNNAHGGSDIGPLAETGVPVVSLSQDGTRYFDIHHTADDTLDKIDPPQLRQNVAAWAAMLAVVANDPTPLGPVQPAGGGD